MLQFEFVLNNEHGLHARPASLLIAACDGFKSKITLHKNGQSYNGKSMLSILKMAASKGDEIRVEVEGEDETEASMEIKRLIDNNFGE